MSNKRKGLGMPIAVLKPGEQRSFEKHVDHSTLREIATRRLREKFPPGEPDSDQNPVDYVIEEEVLRIADEEVRPIVVAFLEKFVRNLQTKPDVIDRNMSEALKEIIKILVLRYCEENAETIDAAMQLTFQTNLEPYIRKATEELLEKALDRVKADMLRPNRPKVD